MNRHSVVNISGILIVLYVIVPFVINAQTQIQTPVLRHDTITPSKSDSSDYQFIRFNFTNVCPIELVDFPERVKEIKKKRDFDTGEMTETLITYWGFKLSKYEITQIQWETVMGTNPSCNKGDLLPVENVSYNDIQAFINKANRVMGTKYYLPTETQWQYAASITCKESYNCYAGTNDITELHKYAWFINNSSGQTHQIGTRLPNERGLFDMNGNVREWCLLSELSENKQFTDVNLPDSIQVIKGSSWTSEADECMLSKRKIYSANFKSNDLGFRLAHEQ